MGRCEMGGIFVPESLPHVSNDFLERIAAMSFVEQAGEIIHFLLPEYDLNTAMGVAIEAFNETNFGSEGMKAQALNPYVEDELILFADKGPSGQVQDYALALMDVMLRRLEAEKKIYLMSSGSIESARAVAAAHNGLSVWRPFILVDHDQRREEGKELDKILQLHEALGIRVEGDRQEIEGLLFRLAADQNYHKRLEEQGIRLIIADESTVTSWLAQQILFIAAFAQLKQQELLPEEEALDLATPLAGMVPILSALYAKGMGLPFGKIICCAPKGHPLNEFIRSGRYRLSTQKGKRQCLTQEYRELPAVLEALFFELSGRNRELLVEWLTELSEVGRFHCGRSIQESWKNHLAAVYSDFKEVEKEARNRYDSTDYLLDRGSCLAFAASKHEKGQRSGKETLLVAAFENPYWESRFAAQATLGRSSQKGQNGQSLRRMVTEEAGITVPPLAEALMELEGEGEEHPYQVCELANLEQYLSDLLMAEARLG